MAEDKAPRLRLQVRGLRRRWMMSSLLVIFLIVLVIGVLFSVTATGNNVRTVREGLVSKASATAGFFQNYITRTYAEYYDSAYMYIEAFEDASKIDLQFIDTEGRVMMSSYTTMAAGTVPGTEDISGAISSKEVRVWEGRNAGTGEHIMAVSAPMTYSDGQVIGVMRYVTSMRLVDRQNIMVILGAAGVGASAMLLVVLINLMFLSTVIDPMREITAVAQRIADGSYGTRISKKYSDEIGDMADVLNDMSVKLSRAEKAQTEFISSVSHELRTPLTAITGWGETLSYDENLPEEDRRGVEIIVKEARRLTKMVEELLDFTRIQDGRFTLNAVEMDAASELEDAIFAYRELLKGELELIYEPSEKDLPLINGDPERLRQVFYNIFDNAAKYAAEGGRLIISTAAENGDVVLRFRDFGPGIPEDELERVKLKFYKGNSKKRGSGIGLAVSDEIIKFHGGTMKLSNAEGGGTLVTIRIPAEEKI